MNLNGIHEENFWSSLYQLTTADHPEQTSEKDAVAQLAKITKLASENKEYWQKESANPFRGRCLVSLSGQIEKITSLNPTAHELANSLKKAAKKHVFPDEVLAKIFYYIDPYLVKCLSRAWRKEIESTYQNYLNELASKFQGKSNSLAKKILSLIENHNVCENDTQNETDSLTVFRHIERLIIKELEQKPKCQILLQNNSITYCRDALSQVIAFMDLLDDYNLVQFCSFEPDIWNLELIKRLYYFINKWAQNQPVSSHENNGTAEAWDKSWYKFRQISIISQAECYRNFLKDDGPFCPSLTLYKPLVELPSYKPLVELPTEVKFLSGLKFMRISNAQLTSLPKEIAQCAQLVVLDLSRNELTNLPSEVGSLTNLTELDLSYNKLSCLQSEVGNFTKLVKLDFSFNELTSLSSEIGKLTALQRLELSYNKLSSLPNEILQLHNLVFVFLSNNQFTSLQNIKQLPARTIIRMNGNPLGYFQMITMLFYRNIGV